MEENVKEFEKEISNSAVGTTPVLVDVEKDTVNIDTNRIEQKITSMTKSVRKEYSLEKKKIYL